MGLRDSWDTGSLHGRTDRQLSGNNGSSLTYGTTDVCCMLASVSLAGRSFQLLASSCSCSCLAHSWSQSVSCLNVGAAAAKNISRSRDSVGVARRWTSGAVCGCRIFGPLSCCSFFKQICGFSSFSCYRYEAESVTAWYRRKGRK